MEEVKPVITGSGRKTVQLMYAAPCHVLLGEKKAAQSGKKENSRTKARNVVNQAFWDEQIVSHCVIPATAQYTHAKSSSYLLLCRYLSAWRIICWWSGLGWATSLEADQFQVAQLVQRKSLTRCFQMYNFRFLTLNLSWCPLPSRLALENMDQFKLK